MSAVLSLKPSYYEALKRLTLELAGVNLGQNHEFLIETRLSALARQEGYDSLLPMIEELFSSGQTRLAVHVVSSLLERDTQFNHERESLDDIVSQVLPPLHRLFKGRTLRILCFGCSSGQEPYSVAMALEKNMDLFPGLKYEILGVDYPSVALDRARTGRYTHFDVQRGLPITDLIQFFDRSAEDWVVKDSLREKIEFKDFHLLSKLDALGEFDIVVFRNRLAQYSSPAQIRVLRELSSVVREHGFLVLGSKEGVADLNFGLEKMPDYAHILSKAEVIVEEPVDPTLKVPNGRKTFDGAKRRIQRARSELSDMRPSKPSKALLVETPLPAQTRAPLTPHNNVNIKSSADVNITSSDDVNKLAAAAPARSQSPDETAEAPHSEPAAAPAKPPMPPPQRSLSQQFKSSELTETGVEDLERELEALFSLDDMLPTGTGGRGSAR